MDYDILIAGGGMVGASLASALAGCPMRVGVLEAVTPSEAQQPSYDERVLAISQGSRRIFQTMGLWTAMAGEANPICRIHVSDRGHLGKARMDASREGVEALGYVLAARAMAPPLVDAMERADKVSLLCPARVLDVRFDSDAVRVEVDQGGARSTLSARLLVAADGGRSLVRELAGIPATRSEYGQTAVIANVTPGHPHGNVAYERFTDTGPLALLPMTGGRCSLVWSVTPEQSGEMMEWGDETFLGRLQERFGQRLGRFKRVGQRHAYPLSLVRVRDQVRPRLAVIGNAAHTIHPIAGQGFNLGLRDVAALAETLADAVAQGRDPGSPPVLEAYARWREVDQRQVMGFTDTLVRVFSNGLPPLALARNLGLLATDLVPGLKHGLARRAMGLTGRQPRLARGLPL